MGLILAAGSLLDASPLQMIEAAVEAGFEGVGLRWSPDWTPEAVAATAREAYEAGINLHDLEVYRIGTPGSALDPLLDAATALGIRRLLVVSDLAGLDATIDAVAATVTGASGAGVEVALEYMAWTTPSNPADAIAVAAATGCQLVVDVLHHVRVGAGVPELRTVVESGHFGWLQLCDAPALAPPDLLHEARHERLLPGEGELPLADLLAEMPRDATISVEVQSDLLTSVLAPINRSRALHVATRRVWQPSRHSG